MEEELNYLSERIEEVEHDIDLTEFGIRKNVRTEGQLIKLQNEKKYLENILNALTQHELNPPYNQIN